MAIVKIPEIDESGNFLNEDVRDRIRELSGGDPLQWSTSRAFDVTARPRRDDTPTIAWATGSGTALTSPVEAKPSIVATGAKVTGWNGQDDPIFRLDPGVYETSIGANNDVAVIGTFKPGGSAQYAGWPVSVSFVAGATNIVEIPVYSGRGNSQLLIEVNGRQVDDTYLWPPTSDTGYSRILTLQFPTTGTRTIRVSGQHAWGFGAVRVAAGGTITKPTGAPRTAAVIGDSFVNGAGSSGDFPNTGAGMQETFAPRLLRTLGYEKRMLAGIGGSGWLTVNSYAGRIPVVLESNPDLLVFFGTVNDGTNPTGLADAAANALASVASVPRVIVIPPGVAGYEGVADQLRTATLAAGREFIEWGQFFTGTGKVTAPAGDGNRDHFIQNDNVHPTLDGHRAMARRLFEEIAG